MDRRCRTARRRERTGPGQWRRAGGNRGTNSRRPPLRSRSRSRRRCSAARRCRTASASAVTPTEPSAGGRKRTGNESSTTPGGGRRSNVPGRSTVTRTVASPSTRLGVDARPTSTSRTASRTGSPPKDQGFGGVSARSSSSSDSPPWISSTRIEPRPRPPARAVAVSIVRGPIPGRSAVIVRSGSGATRNHRTAAAAASTTAPTASATAQGGRRPPRRTQPVGFFLAERQGPRTRQPTCSSSTQLPPGIGISPWSSSPRDVAVEVERRLRVTHHDAQIDRILRQFLHPQQPPPSWRRSPSWKRRFRSGSGCYPATAPNSAPRPIRG